ncbi:hypothetical protein [Microbispora sp. NPDC049125]|uniref:hypothetical protein n=1 Tax=Microbispora sp. NPDC049125 TaxID=3154929 RepID=UPI003467ECCD
MAPLNPPTWLQAGTYPARYDRLAAGSMLPPLQGTGPLAVRSGVKPSAGGVGLQVTQRSTPAMYVTVNAGAAFIQSPSATGGTYLVHNDAAYDIAITAAHATLGRRDLIVARIFDAEITGVTNQWTLEVVTGTPAGSPVVPATPSGALPLASILVSAGATSITNAAITDQRVYTVALGGAIPAPATALPANPYTGMAAYDLTNLLPKWYSGSAWRSWQDEGYVTPAYLTSNGYMTQAALDTAGYKPVTYAVKTADQSRANTTTPAADSELFLPVAANSTYWLDCFIIYDGPTSADLQIGWTAPSGTTMYWVSDLLDPAITGTPAPGLASVSRTQQGLANLPSGGARSTGNPAVAPIRGWLQTSGTSGNLTCRWAQATADAVAIKILTGSAIKLTKLA